MRGLPCKFGEVLVGAPVGCQRLVLLRTVVTFRNESISLSRTMPIVITDADILNGSVLSRIGILVVCAKICQNVRQGSLLPVSTLIKAVDEQADTGPA